MPRILHGIGEEGGRPICIQARSLRSVRPSQLKPAYSLGIINTYILWVFLALVLSYKEHIAEKKRSSSRAKASVFSIEERSKRSKR